MKTKSKTVAVPPSNGVQKKNISKQQKNVKKANNGRAPAGANLKTPQKQKQSTKKLPKPAENVFNDDDDDDDDELSGKGDADAEIEEESDVLEDENAPASDEEEAPPSDEEEAPASDEEEAPASDEEEAPASDEEEAPASDEAPVEVPIKKFKAKKPVSSEDGVREICTGKVPKSMPNDQVIFIKSLPTRFEQIDIVKVFAKYGTIHTISIAYGPVTSTAMVAFTTPEAATAALATNNKAVVRGYKIVVSLRMTNQERQIHKEKQKKERDEFTKQINEKADRTVFLRYVKNGTTMEQIEAHFADCGVIENISLMYTKIEHFGVSVIFEKEESVEAAKKLNGSILNGSNITVWPKIPSIIKPYPKHSDRTILIRNTAQLECIDGDRLKATFSQCGEIEHLDLLCGRNVLAFITFVKESSAQESFKLNGKTIDGLELSIEKYKRAKATIFVKNVKPGVTEEQIRELFAESGPIKAIKVLRGFAVIDFENLDGYCKSFLLHEASLQGQTVYIEPYTHHRKAVLNKASGFGGGGAGGGAGGFKRKFNNAPNGGHQKKMKQSF